MKKFKINKYLIALIILIIVGFFMFSFKNYIIQEGFTSLPLSFNPTNSVSSYNWNGATVTIQGGFVKGKIIDANKQENLLLRSLSPTPQITVKGDTSGSKIYLIQVENINPLSTDIKNIDKSKIKIISSHTLQLTIDLKANEERKIDVVPKDKTEGFEFVMLGDNRDGYQTFSTILDQINAINPVFTVDDGDLVFGGEPNRYRLFYQTISKLRVPLYTTLGNHDIRENGRPTYTILFGPPYYSFDYKNVHFIFLDSSRGWAEKTAIPEEQYQWLENDLKNSQGKQTFVFSHIPPTDPREYVDPNLIPEIPDEEKPSILERLMNNYSQYKSLNHGFPDKNEAKKFENLMTKYNVNTVFLSHIHSYFSYIKDDVRYVISGGGGAELLTKDSYYHYLRVKVTDKDTFLEAIELPSPTNTIVDRYLAAGQLFANALYKEYRTIVIAITAVILCIIAWLIWNNRYKWKTRLLFWGRFLTHLFKAAVELYKRTKEDIYDK